MAIFNFGDQARSASGDRNIQMTMEEFKKWLMGFDHDKDGRISRKELRAAIKNRGALFGLRKSNRGMNEADVDGSGYIDEDEINNLAEFAEKNMGIRIC